jgi:ATP-binding cassette subfamily B multidrug efflux pump
MPEKRKANKIQATPGVSSMSAMEKSNDLKKAYSDFFVYFGRFKLLLGVAIVFSIVGAIFNLVGPGKLSEITNLITEGLAGTIAVDKITRIAIILAVLYGLGFVLNYIQGFIMATITQKCYKKYAS